MAEKIKIKVHPSGTSSDMLTVADAMRQVLDFIELLEKADPAEPSSPDKIIWRLAYATTNSPFEIGAEATSRDPVISVAAKARMTKETVRSALRNLVEVADPIVTFDDDMAKPLTRLLERNLNGIGRTDIDFGDDISPAIIVHATAQAAHLAIERDRLAKESLIPDLTRTEFGSFEGEIVSAGMFHSSPSLVVRHRLTGEKVTSVFPPELAFRIGSQHNWFEVWAGRRVLIHGELHHDQEGIIRKATAFDFEVIEEADVSLNEARKVDLLDGLTVSDFLDRQWAS
ncbi:MAG: hypothetical protein E5Y89_06420 [Mesorhizobium sp.]|nr:MAG: hypothetical protein E5Y89_06420 [Mesorhizobium sp.]